jgi:hypothetical protein
MLWLGLTKNSKLKNQNCLRTQAQSGAAAAQQKKRKLKVVEIENIVTLYMRAKFLTLGYVDQIKLRHRLSRSEGLLTLALYSVPPLSLRKLFLARIYLIPSQQLNRIKKYSRTTKP